MAAAVACVALVTACSKSQTTDSSASSAPASPSASASEASPAAESSGATVAPVAAASSQWMQTAAPALAGYQTPYPNLVPPVAVSYSDIAGDIDAPSITALGKLGVLDSTSGAFKPNDPCKRRDFVRWLFKANNVLFGNTAEKTIHPGTPDETPAFKDLPSSDPDFQYVQGMADTGVSVGFPDKTFRPDQPITREQAVAIKAVLDSGGVNSSLLGPNNANFAYFTLPAWKDKKAVSVTFVGAIAQDVGQEGTGKVNNIGRTFGAISVFRPKAVVTRGQAATMLTVIGGHDANMAYGNAMKTTDQIFAAEAAAAAAPATTATP